MISIARLIFIQRQFDVNDFWGKKAARKLFALIGIGLLLGTSGFSQTLGISGPTTVVPGTSYTYQGTVNGTFTYAYSGSYTWTITNGVVTGTSNTFKTGTASGVIGSVSVNVTWSSGSGTLTLQCPGGGLGTTFINISAPAPLQPGTLSPSSQSINYGATASTITGTVATGGAISPVYNYQWMSSPDNVNWTTIGGATSLNYSPGQMFATTYFRRRVTETTTSQVAYTSSATVIIYPQIVCTISPQSQAIDNGTAPSALTSVTTGGNGSYTYQWQTSLDNISWQNVATTANYSPGILTQTKYIWLIATSNGLKDTSNKAVVAINRALGKGIDDPLRTDTIPLAKDSLRITQYTNDAFSFSHSIQNVLAFKVVEETPKYIPGDFSATAVCKVEYGHSATPPYNTIDSIKLYVNYTKNAGNKYNGLNYFTFRNAEFVKVTVIRIEAPTTVNGVSFDTKQVLLLTNSLAANRVFQMVDNKKPTLNSPTATGDALNTSWAFPVNTNNNATQFEWAWMEDEMRSAYAKGSLFDTSLLFKLNSTRIDLPAAATGYSIPLLYGGTGKLYIRVRGVNIMPSGSRSDGPWSDVQFYAFSGHSDSLNWQSITTFAEEGKRKTVIQYFDGSLRSRQTVTKDNSTNTTVVAETLYDAQGRPAIQVLPAPGINNIIAYTKFLNKFNTQPDDTSKNPLDYYDFSTPALGKYGTTPMDTSRGTNLYYSSGNSEKNLTSYNKNIPAANGFAYAVTRYTPDATGRVMIQGGVGDSMQMKYNHTTRYYYGTPAQEELDALFGTEVGNYTHYFKNMVQDPNGQISVSYVDMHGRTIATALAGQSPSSMQALNITDTNQYKNQAAKIMTRNLLDSNTNVLKGNAIESINTILVPYPTAYTFNYNLRKQWLKLPICSGATITDTCWFDLQIVISDESDSTVATYNYTGIDTINFQNSIVLQVGSYRVRKSLTINKDSLANFLQKYDTLSMGICKSLQFLTDSIAAQDSTASGCGVSATPLTTSSCLTSLTPYSTYLLNYAINLGYTLVSQLSAMQVADIRNQYISDSMFCVSLNANTSHTLESIRRQMLMDMVPDSGQYAKNAGSGTMYNKFSIFSTNGGYTYTQPFYKYPKNESGVTDNYYTAYGIVDSTVLAAKLNTMNSTDFESQFANSWASSLLFYHPEFRRLKYAETTMQPSYNYIDSLNQTVTVAFNPVTSDPFFNVISTTADKNTIKKYSDTSWLNNWSIWQMAYGDGFGCKLYPDTNQSKICYGNMPKTFTATGTSVNTGFGSVTLSAAIQSQSWAMYKAFYTQSRGDMVNKWICFHTDTTDNFHANTVDNSTLVAQKFRLYFPVNNVQLSQNLGWTGWYPNSAGVYPTVNIADSAKNYNNHCDGYINSWRLALINCPALIAKVPDSLKREQVIASITARMDSVCKYGTDPGNPFGASNVAPANLGKPNKNFEQVIQSVFDTLGGGGGIPRSDVYCNPYVIEYPKPYGKNPVIAKQFISGVDTCTCSRFAQIKLDVYGQDYDSSSLIAINNYLRAKYQDTISVVLYQGLQKCGQTTQLISLASVQPLASFLNCGSGDSSYTCYNCANFKKYDTLFNSLFGRHPVFTGTLTDSDVVYNNLFAQFVNYKTGLQHSWQFYADTLSHTGCPVGGILGDQWPLSVCMNPKPLNDTTGMSNPVSPCQRVRNQATVKATSIYSSAEQQLLANFNASYVTKCFSVIESFKVTDSLKEYHYTLYYYDQAGNLVKTVPPKGVNPIYRQTWIDSVEKIYKPAGNLLVPAHSFTTRYSYNSLNQVNIQKSPDGGVSKFYYDRLGRLAISQNAQQKAMGNVYSYTFYDSLGRITQVGQITASTAMTDATAKSEASLQTWFSNNSTKRAQITQTVYDTAYGGFTGISPTPLIQQNLRNRVSFSQLSDTASDQAPASATYYSYDIHGNVDTLVQDYGNSLYKRNPMNSNNDGSQSGNRFKKIVYNFDLVSGKVNQVSYQPGQSDAYYHRYYYDAENRITDVYTGRDSIMLFIFREREAHYNYYKHGPLAQTILGQLQVQRQDYAYTLQGWIKGINPVMGGSLANGTDTTEAFPVAQDIYGFSLHYYKNDYRAIAWNPASTGVLAALTTNAAPLYNGNIAAMAVNIPQLSATKLYNYHYDQLNRIASMDMYNGLNPNAGTFSPAAVTDYKERVSYDPNGNILGYLRNGDANKSMDSLSYKYYANTNRLQLIKDTVAAARFPSDIDNEVTTNNYTYDAIGNLVTDVSESITAINWNVYGKISNIIKGGQTIKYNYDASGNRISKYTSTDSTFYLRDATGNVMSVYVKPAGGTLAQTEALLYGSSRLGMATKHLVPDSVVVLSGGFASGIKTIFTRGEKLFELTNHLGNVLVTIGDRRMQASAVGVNVDAYKADIASANDYYPFGSLMPGRKYSASGLYMYGFNGKENDNDVKGDGNQQDYGMRIYDPRLGRFLSVDPITKNYPSLTPYQFASNSPIGAIDLDGLEKVTVVNNCFAPFDWFGYDGFGQYGGDGDNRKFGDGGTYRVSGTVSLDLATQKMTAATAGKTSSIYFRFNPPSTDIAQSSSHNIVSFYSDPEKKSSNVDFHVYGHDEAVNVVGIKVPGAVIPDIDVKVNVSFQALSPGEFMVTGNVRGDKFPADETYLTDEKGNKLILAVSGAGTGKMGPYKMLWGDNNRDMGSFNLSVSFNGDNSFKSVLLNGKTYTIEEWNKQFTALDPKKTSLNTCTTNTNNQIKENCDDEKSN